MRKLVILLVLASFLVPIASLAPVTAKGPDDRYFRVRTKVLENGAVLAETLISGPPDPPAGFQRATSEALVPAAAEGVNILSDVPAFNWSFGCSATSAAMIAGYYDRTGYGNMYTGPTNGGVMPLDNSSWPDWQDSGGDTRHQCPLSATHYGLDGRDSEGHVDDYWVYYGHAGPDPLGADGLEHTHGDCTGDFMKTNQSAYGNVDGGTAFWNYNTGQPLHCSDMPGHGIDNDGGYGLGLFYESRGYSVTNCYNQYIRERASIPLFGFTFAQYKAEIDAGRPVMIHVQGHTMVGIGYDDASNLMYIHDTWDYQTHTMTWAGSYAGMQHYAVTIVQLAPSTEPPAAPSGLVATSAGPDQIDLAWTDNSADESGFRIERSPDASAWTLIDTVGADVTNYQDTGLSASTTYYYRLYAYNAAGNSGYSNVASATTDDDTTPPAAPTGLAATGRDGAVDLVWSASGEPDLAGYTVYRATTSGGPYSKQTVSLLTEPSYTDSSVTNGTTYFYVATASDNGGNESGYSNEASATPQAQSSENVATADHATTYGSVTGTYEATHAQDNVYQSITEVHSGGRPSLRYDRLEQIWRFDLTGGNHVLNIDAYYVDAGDADSGFEFSWSDSPTGPWNYLTTVTKTADDDGYHAADLGSVSGTIYVRAIDNDRTQGQNSNDTLHVDHMYIDGGSPPTEPPEPATNPEPVDGATGVTTTPTLSWTMGARAESHDVYFGTNPLPDLIGNQTETNFSPGTLELGTTYYWRIDEVNSVGTTPGPVWSFTTRSSEGPETLHVDSIVLDTVKADPSLVRGRATVIVVDDLGNFVAAAEVTGAFTGDFDETQNGVTNDSGTALLITTGMTRKPVFTFCVDDIVHAALTYAPDDNLVTCASYP